MKIFFSIWILSCIACFGIQGTPDDKDEVFAIGLGYATNHLDYFIKWDQLSSKTSWDPKAESFPLKLGIEARRASAFIIGEKHITNEMHLNRVTIRRLNVLKSEAEQHGKSPSDLEKTWTVEMEFLVQPVEESQRPPLERVLMLLDGSYATGKRIHDLHMDTASASDSPEPHSRDNKKKKKVDGYPYDTIRRSTFTIPGVQWKPDAGELPLDLTSANDRSLSCLTTQESNFEGSLYLKEISIDPFIPYEAARASNLSVLEHLHHWFVIFRYCDATGKSEGGFDVYTLLDGTILQVVSRDFCP